MPIIIKDFNWRQTDTIITISVPLKGVHPSKVDVFTSARYIKLSFIPYFFEVVLLDTIEPKTSRCTFAGTHAILELVKSELKQWDTLECNLNKREKNELKRQCIEEEFKLHQDRCKAASEKRHELKRVSVREQIALDTRNRDKIDKIREEEKCNALGDLKEWRRSLPNEELNEQGRQDDENRGGMKDDENRGRKNDYGGEEGNDDDGGNGDDNEGGKNNDEGAKKRKGVFESPDTSETESSDSEMYDVNYISETKKYVDNILEEGKKEQEVQPVRSTQTLEVTFTEREFVTPSRESKLEEENEWLRKQAEAKRTVGFNDKDLRPDEKNPLNMKCKGDEFLKQKNYLGAISAYSFGIKLSKNFVDLYIGRSEAHYAIGNLYKCIRDCSDALDLLKPEVPANLDQRVTVILRRGQCLFNMKMREKGVQEMRAALRLQPDNANVKAELEKAQEIWEDDDSN